MLMMDIDGSINLFLQQSPVWLGGACDAWRDVELQAGAIFGEACEDSGQILDARVVIAVPYDLEPPSSPKSKSTAPHSTHPLLLD